MKNDRFLDSVELIPGMTLRIEANAKYFAQVGEEMGIAALGWRPRENKRHAKMLGEVRARVKWYRPASNDYKM